MTKTTVKTLIKKEFRQLLPLAILIFLLMSLNLVYEPLSGRPDETTWVEVTGYLEPANEESSALLFLILGLMTAFSLFPREYDEKTIEFLFSLPISRSAVFLSKLFTALFILEGGFLLCLVVDWVLQIPNTQSFTGAQFRLNIALSITLLHFVYIFVVLSHGILLSFFRRFGLIIYGILWWMVWTFETTLPFFKYLNFMNILSLEYHGQTLLIPWRLLFLHSSIAGITLLVAAFLWTTPAERFSHWYEKLPQYRWGRVILIGAVGCIFILFVLIIYRIGEDAVDDTSVSEYYESFESARFSTRHYHFTYPVNLREPAIFLIDKADVVYENIQGRLSAQKTDPVVVDLTEVSVEHAGVAGWQKIRMDIHGKPDPLENLHTLYHETSHIFATSESNRKIFDHNKSTLFFNEGLAEYLSYRMVENESKLFALRLLAAASWKRQKIDFYKLTDISSFKAKYNENLQYPLGELWVKALVQTCGENAMGDTLRAMNRENAPKDIEGMIFWQDTLQSIGCDIERVTADWVRLLSDITIEHKEAIKRIPRLSGGVSGDEDGDIVLKAYPDRSAINPAYRFVVRVRDNADEEESDVKFYYSTLESDVDPMEVVFHIPSSQFVGNRFDFQFGVRFEEGVFPYYEMWQSGAIP